MLWCTNTYIFKTLNLRKGRKITFLATVKQKRFNNYKNTVYNAYLLVKVKKEKEKKYSVLDMLINILPKKETLLH